MDLLTTIAFFAIHFGIAGLLGSQFYRMNSLILAMAAGALVLLAPWMLPPFTLVCAYVLATMIVWLYATKPGFAPAALWQIGFGLRYWALALGLITVWGLGQAQLSAGFFTGSLAGVAALLAWGRSLQTS